MGQHRPPPVLLLLLLLAPACSSGARGAHPSCAQVTLCPVPGGAVLGGGGGGWDLAFCHRWQAGGEGRLRDRRVAAAGSAWSSAGVGRGTRAGCGDPVPGTRETLRNHRLLRGGRCGSEPGLQVKW